MIYKAIFLSLGLLTLINCDAQKKVKSSDKTSINTTKQKPMNKHGEIIYFNEGENKFLKEYEMNVTFKGISEDSRCPEGVNCMWAGTAVAQIEIMGTYTRPSTIALATVDHEGRNYHRSSGFNGYTISLAEVTPYPNAKDGAKALNGKYKIGIIVSKEGEKTDSTTK